MDPVSAFGIAAGAVQFVDFNFRGILESLSFLRSLKHTPERVKELIQDLEQSVKRIVALQNATKQPSSATFHLSLAQLQRLERKLDAVCCAMAELQTDLVSLSMGDSAKGIR